MVEEGITRIGDQLFHRCYELEEITLNEGVQIIGRNAFLACRGLKKINIPCSVTEIHQRAFVSTTPEVINYAGNIEQWSKIVIEPYNLALENVTVGISR